MYQITYRPIATQEYENAIKWYFERNQATAERFVKAVNEKLDNLSSNPLQYKSLFKKFHEVSTGKFPYTIVYLVDEAQERVVIVAIYHQKRHPKKKHRR